MKSPNDTVESMELLPMQRDMILEFIRQHDLCVLSTVTSNANAKSESALVGFSENQEFELMVGMTTDSRKFRNLTTNPYVSVVIGWDAGITVQYEGSARVLRDDQDLQAYQINHFAKLPGAIKYKDHPRQCYIVIMPHWLRYTDTNKSPRLIREITF